MEDTIQYPITKEVLSDFATTIKAKPNLTQKEIFEKFPEFKNDTNFLQSAVDYVTTANSGKYKTVEEIDSKFPEFSFSETTSPAPPVQSEEIPTVTMDKQGNQSPVIQVDYKQRNAIFDRAALVPTMLEDKYTKSVFINTMAKKEGVDPRAVKNLIEGYQKDSEAINQLQEAYRIENNPETLYQLAQLHTRIGQYDKATDAYNVLVKNPDTQAEAFAGMAQVAHEQGDYKASKDFQEKARSLGAYNNADLPMVGGNDKIQAGNEQTYLGDNPEQQVPVGSDTRASSYIKDILHAAKEASFIAPTMESGVEMVGSGVGKIKDALERSQLGSPENLRSIAQMKKRTGYGDAASAFLNTAANTARAVAGGIEGMIGMSVSTPTGAGMLKGFEILQQASPEAAEWIMPTTKLVNEHYKEKKETPPEWTTDAAAITDMAIAILVHSGYNAAKGKIAFNKDMKSAFNEAIDNIKKNPQEIDRLARENDAIYREFGNNPEVWSKKIAAVADEASAAAQEIKVEQKAQEPYNPIPQPETLKTVPNGADVMMNGETGKIEYGEDGTPYFNNGEKSTQIKVTDKFNPTESLHELGIQVLPDISPEHIARAVADGEQVGFTEYNGKKYFVSLGSESAGSNVGDLVNRVRDDGTHKPVFDARDTKNQDFMKNMKLAIVNKFLSEKGLPAREKLYEPWSEKKVEVSKVEQTTPKITEEVKSEPISVNESKTKTDGEEVKTETKEGQQNVLNQQTEVQGESQTMIEPSLPASEKVGDGYFKIDDKDIFYHASNTKRNGRLNTNTAKGFGTGVYFTTSKEVASHEFGEHVTEAKLALDNPVYTNTKEWYSVEELAIEKANEGKEKDEDGYIIDEEYDIAEIKSKFISDAAKELGYDAIIDKNSSKYKNEILVLDETKIKYPEDIDQSLKETAPIGQVSPKEAVKEVAPSEPVKPVEQKVEKGEIKKKATEIVVKSKPKKKVSENNKLNELRYKAEKKALQEQLSSIDNILLGDKKEIFEEKKGDFEGNKQFGIDDYKAQLIKERIAESSLSDINNQLKKHGAKLNESGQIELALPNGKATFKAEDISRIKAETDKMSTSFSSPTVKVSKGGKFSESVMGLWGSAIDAKDAVQMAKDNLAEAQKSGNKDLIAIFKRQHDLAIDEYDNARSAHINNERDAIIQTIDDKYAKQHEKLTYEAELAQREVSSIERMKGKGYKANAQSAEAIRQLKQRALDDLDAKIREEKAPYYTEAWSKNKLAEWDNATPEAIETIKENLDNGTITKEDVNGFTRQSEEGLIGTESAIENLESKAESTKEADLIEAVKEADELITKTKEKSIQKQSTGSIESAEMDNVYHGGDIFDLNSISEDQPFFVTKSEAEAIAYSKGNEGHVSIAKIDLSKIAKESVARKILADLGYADEFMLHELVDPIFEDTYIGEKNVKKLYSELKKQGYEGVEFTDSGIANTKHVTNILLIEPKKTLENSGIGTSRIVGERKAQELLDEGYSPVIDGKIVEKATEQDLDNHFAKNETINMVKDIHKLKPEVKPTPLEKVSEQNPLTEKVDAGSVKPETGIDKMLSDSQKKRKAALDFAKKYGGGNNTPEGTKKAGAGLEDIINGIFDVYDKALKTTKDVKEAVKAALDEIKKHYNAKTIDETVKGKLEEMVAEEGKPNTTGVTHSQTAAIAEELGLEQYKKEVQEEKEWEAEAENRLKTDKNTVPDLIEKLKSGGGADPVDQKVMQRYISSLVAEIKNNPTNELLEKLQEATYLSDAVAGSDIARSLRARQGSVDIENTLGGWLLQEKAASKVEELTPAQIKEVEQKFNEYEEKLAQEKIAYEELQDKYNTLEAEHQLTQVKREARNKKRSVTKEILDKEFDDLAKEIKGFSNTLSSGVNPELAIKASAIITKMVRNRVEKGIVNLAEIVDSIYDKVQDSGLSKRDIRDIIAKKYGAEKKTKTEIQQALLDIMEEQKLLDKLDAIMSGNESKTEKGKIIRNQKITELREKIREVKNRKTPLTEEEKTEIKTKAGLKNIKTRNIREINRLKEKINSGDFVKEKTLPMLENVTLKKKYPELFNAALDATIAREKVKHEFDMRQYEHEQSLRSTNKKIADGFIKTVNTLKAIKAGFDDSAVMVQNGFSMLNAMNFKEGIKAFKQHIKDFPSEKEFNREMVRIHNMPSWDMISRSGLDVLDPKSLRSLNRGEEIGVTWMDEKFKVNGKTYSLGKYTSAPFERAFTSFGNHFRINMFLKQAEVLLAEGKTIDSHPKEYKGIADVINNMTGRGKTTPAIEKAHSLVTAVIWAPKLLASGFNILGISDAASLFTGGKGYYRNKSGAALKYALKQTGAGIATGLSVMVAAKMMGATVDDDPTSVTFGNISFKEDSELHKYFKGNEYNVFGRFTPIVRQIAMWYTGKKTINGKTRELKSGIGQGSYGHELIKFGRGKMTPFAGEIFSGITGTMYDERTPFTLKNELKENITPMSVSELKKATDADGTIGILLRATPSFFGMKVSNSADYKKEPASTPSSPEKRDAMKEINKIKSEAQKPANDARKEALKARREALKK